MRAPMARFAHWWFCVPPGVEVLFGMVICGVNAAVLPAVQPSDR